MPCRPQLNSLIHTLALGAWTALGSTASGAPHPQWWEQRSKSGGDRLKIADCATLRDVRSDRLTEPRRRFAGGRALHAPSDTSNIPQHDIDKRSGLCITQSLDLGRCSRIPAAERRQLGTPTFTRRATKTKDTRPVEQET